MGVLDFILPTPQKQQEQLSTLIQKQITNIMQDTKFGAASAITEDVTVLSSGAGSRNKGINLKQVATINVSAFLNDKTALDLKSDLKERLKNSIKIEASNMPLGQEPNVNTKIANAVDKSIETGFSHSSIIELNNSVKLGIRVVSMADATGGGSNEDIKVDQRGDVIMKFTNTIATDIASQLIGKTEIKNDNDMKTTNFLSETIDSIGKGISSVLGTLFTGIYAGPVMMFVMFMAVVLVGVYIVKGGGSTATPPAMMYAPPMAAPVGGVGLENLGIDISALPPIGGR